MKKHATRGPVWNALKLHLQLRKPDKNMAHRHQTLHCHLTRLIQKSGDRCSEHCSLCPFTDVNYRRMGLWFMFDNCYKWKYTVVK